MSKVLQGKTGEDLARRYLEERGLTLVERNFRCRRGELDLIMRDGEELVFVEVRCRRNTDFGTPAETVTLTKQRRLIRAAARYLQSHRFDVPCRFDIIAITQLQGQSRLEWIRNAFQAR